MRSEAIWFTDRFGNGEKGRVRLWSEKVHLTPLWHMLLAANTAWSKLDRGRPGSDQQLVNVVSFDSMLELVRPDWSRSRLPLSTTIHLFPNCRQTCLQVWETVFTQGIQCIEC